MCKVGEFWDALMENAKVLQATTLVESRVELVHEKRAVSVNHSERATHRTHLSEADVKRPAQCDTFRCEVRSLCAEITRGTTRRESDLMQVSAVAQTLFFSMS